MLFSLLAYVYQHNLISGNNLQDGNSKLRKFQRRLLSWCSSLAGNRNYCPPADEREPNPGRFTIQIPSQKHLIRLDRLPISSWTLCAGVNLLAESFEVCPADYWCTSASQQRKASQLLTGGSLSLTQPAYFPGIEWTSISRTESAFITQHANCNRSGGSPASPSTGQCLALPHQLSPVILPSTRTLLLALVPN